MDCLWLAECFGKTIPQGGPNHAGGFEAERLAIANDQVVEEPHAHSGRRGLQRFRYLPIMRRGTGIAARVVVRQNEPTCLVRDFALDDFPDIDDRLVHGPP